MKQAKRNFLHGRPFAILSSYNYCHARKKKPSGLCGGASSAYLACVADCRGYMRELAYAADGMTGWHKWHGV